MVISSHEIIHDNKISVNPEVLDEFPTIDHYPMHFVLCNDMMINDGKKEIEFRNLKAVDPELFKLDITNFLSNSGKWLNSFSDSINLFNDGCQKVLDTHAPTQKKVMRVLETAPWFDSEYKQLRIKRRKAEKQWIKSLLDSDKTVYYNLRQ